jgi:hypothetical protein
MREPTAFETCETEPALPSVRPPPSSGRYSWVDPARLETVPAACSEDEAELSRRFPQIGKGTMPVVRVPKF